MYIKLNGKIKKGNLQTVNFPFIFSFLRMPHYHNSDNFNIKNNEPIGLVEDFFTPKLGCFGWHWGVGFFVIASSFCLAHDISVITNSN